MKVHKRLLELKKVVSALLGPIYFLKEVEYLLGPFGNAHCLLHRVLDLQVLDTQESFPEITHIKRQGFNALSKQALLFVRIDKVLSSQLTQCSNPIACILLHLAHFDLLYQIFLVY